MKKFISVIILSVLLLTAVAYAENRDRCYGRFGLAFVDKDIVYKFVDVDCNDLWDVILEYKSKQGVYNFTGKHWNCPIEYRTLQITEVETE